MKEFLVAKKMFNSSKPSMVPNLLNKKILSLLEKSAAKAQVYAEHKTIMAEKALVDAKKVALIAKKAEAKMNQAGKRVSQEEEKGDKKNPKTTKHSDMEVDAMWNENKWVKRMGLESLHV